MDRRHSCPWRVLACLILGTFQLQANRIDDDAATAFFQGPILRWEISLEESALQALRQDPRGYVRGRLRAGDHSVLEVGLHLKGSAGSKRPVDDKPSWTVDIDRFHPGQTLFGETKFHLNNAVQDGTYLNQNLASRVYRAAGIPATRSSHALVTLNERDLGIYVVVETYDNRYLRRAFPAEGKRPGNLYEGAFVGDIERNLQRDGGYGATDQADLVRLRQATEVPVPERLAALQRVLDVDAFLTLSAIQLALDDWDGYLRNRNNYRIHFRATDGRGIFLPSGVDQLLGHADAPVRDGWRGRVATSLFSIPGQQLQLRSRLRELSSNVLSEKFLTNQVMEIETRLERALAKSASPESGVGRGMLDRHLALSRIHQRLEVVRRELAAWPDPLPAWPRGHQVTPNGWQPYVQHGQAEIQMPADAPIHLTAQAAGTLASVRTSLTVPAGSYRLSARARCQGVVAVRDQFGAGAGVRLTGATREQALEGDADWRPVHFDFQQDDDGPVELILELRADAGEAWFYEVVVIALPVD